MKKGIYGKIRIIFSSIILANILLLELYIMINDSKNYIILAGCTLFFLITLYVLISVIINKIHNEQIMKQEHYENIYKAEKASYIMIRKSFNELDDRLKQLEGRVNPLDKVLGSNEKTIEHMFKKVLEEQKKVAKITIGKGKSNSDALIDANDKLKEKIFEYDKKLDNIKEDMLEKQNAAMIKKLADFQERQTSFISLEIKKVEESQREITALLKQLELSIRNQVLDAVNKLALNQPQIIMTSPQSMSPIEPAKESINVEAVAQQNIEKEGPEDITPLLGNVGNEKEEEQMTDWSDSKEMMNPEDITTLLAETEDTFNWEEALTEPEEEEKPAMPEISDPNKMMSPEDIAALIAGAGETMPEEEEKPAMPEISDPNKMMSPEDIAALIANM